MNRLQRYWHWTRLGHWLYERRAERERLADFHRRMAKIEEGNRRYVYRLTGKWPKR